MDGSQPYAQVEFTLQAEPHVALVSDARFQEFRMRSCHAPLQFKNSVCGRVFRTGACQILQNLRLVPPTMHPRSYLKEELLDSVSEVLYIPVYDQLRPGVGPVTVLEALLAAHSPHAITSADLLSFVSAGLGSLQLSVSNPLPQPVKRSALCGRRARAPVDSDSDMQRQQQPQQQQRIVSPDVTMAAADVQQQQQRHVVLQQVAAAAVHPAQSSACPAVSSGATHAVASMDISLARPAISSPATGPSHAAAAAAAHGHSHQHEAQSGLQQGGAEAMSRPGLHGMAGIAATMQQSDSSAAVGIGQQQHQQQQQGSEEAMVPLPRKVRRVGQGALVRTKSMYIFNTAAISTAGNLAPEAGCTANTADQHISIQAAAAGVVSCMAGVGLAQHCPGAALQPAAAVTAPVAVALPSAALCPVTAALG